LFNLAFPGLSARVGVSGGGKTVGKGCSHVGTHGQRHLFPEQGAAFMQDGNVGWYMEFLHDFVDQVLHGFASPFFNGFV
jgi:hypothetical protein